MRLKFSIIILLISTKALISQTTIRILAIGNSFSEDALESYVDDLAKADGVQLIIGNMYIGGCSLQTHWANASSNAAAYSYRKIVNGDTTVYAGRTLASAITDEQWDYISFQQVSQYSGKYVTYYPYITNLINYTKSRATNPAVKLCLHRTWAYATNSTHTEYDYYQSNQKIMFDSIVNVTKRVASEAGLQTIIPSGTAIQNARSSYIGDNFTRDGYHLTTGLGRYVAACTWYQKITGRNVIGNTFAPKVLSAKEIEIAQKAANFAILKPDSVTSMAENIVYVQNGTIQVDFGSTTSASPWNNLSNYSLNSGINNLLNSDGAPTTISISISDAFGGINANGPTTTSTGYNFASTASGDSFWGNSVVFNGVTEPTAGFTLSGLNPEKEYDFRILSARAGVTDNRETVVKVTGLTTLSDSVNASNNTSLLINFLSVKPKTDGTLSFALRAGLHNNNANKFFYINSMLITESSLTSVDKTINTCNLKLYPNPATGFLTIQTDQTLEDAKIIDISGREIMNLSKIESGKNTINLSRLGKGYYIFKSGSNQSFFIKQ